MLKITTIRPEEMRTSAWSGGTTTEIMIFPAGSVYAQRDFLFRISTAKVELDESDFTSLPDYNRIIGSIEGAMDLTHGSSGEITVIEPGKTVHRFDGGVPTHCVGRARDLNLMLRKAKASGDMRFLADGDRCMLRLEPNEFALVYGLRDGVARFAETDEEDYFVFCADGPSALFTVELTEE
ncbi:MAG: HutD family protein [Clostridia bacterium]|nr:HutD family protein [Clostridia bacterium]